MKTSEIYSRAKDILWDGKEDIPHLSGEKYICDIITHHPNLNPLLDEHEVDEATNFIHELLGPDQFSLQTWLVSNGHATSIEVSNNTVKMQATRIAFLDHLIDHFKAKGQ